MKSIFSPFSWVCLFLTFLFMLKGYSQESETLKISEKLALRYEKQGKADPALISGDYYQTPRFSNETGHPYCVNAEWKDGKVTLDGKLYEGLLLKYDIHNHLLVLNTLHLTKSLLQVSLRTSSISRFSIEESTFVPYPSKTVKGHVQFAELLAEGPLSLLILRTKRTRVATGGNVDFLYQEDITRSLVYEDQLIPYRGKKTILKIMPEHKKEINSYIKSNSLRLSRKQYANHAKLIQFCNSLMEGTA